MKTESLFKGASVYTIAPGAPFLDALLAGLEVISKGLGIEAADITLFLPNRRSLRAFRDAFLTRGQGKAGFLPRLYALGDLDDDEASLPPLAFSEEAALPPAVPPLQRLFLIQRELAKRAPKAERNLFLGEQGLSLAVELARLFDQMAEEGISPAGLKELAPESYAEHWGKTLAYLSVMTKTWPGLLKTKGLMDAVPRRNAVIERLIQAWQAAPPAKPVIAAGSTGSIPAVRRLLSAIARLPRGAVVLPGFDPAPDAETWEAIGETHPQFVLKATVEAIGIGREDVKPWPFAPSPPSAPRLSFLTTALAPAELTAGWHRAKIDPKAATQRLEILECVSPAEEAGAIALLLREALERKSETAALVTPDRALARRVAAELRRFAIRVDDSAGTPLSGVPGGIFIRLLADMAAEGFAPVPLLAFLKHPFAAGGWSRAAWLRSARLLDQFVLRGVRPGAGLAALSREAAAINDAKARQDARRLLEVLERHAGKLAAMLRQRTLPFAAALTAHVEAAVALAGGGEAGAPFGGDDGAELRRFLDELREHARALGAIHGRDYPGLFQALLGARQYRPRFSAHPRIQILGALEARLQTFDLVVLGGFNEGAWPPAPPPDPWMSREMRRTLGLPLHDVRIGQSAHDFLMAASGPRVALTRALKVEGTPTVPSRWLSRMRTLLAGTLPRHAARPWIAWQRSLDRPAGPETRVGPPAPRPPVKLRPRQLSVTQIESWVRDPYSIYARHVLKLKPLEEIDAPPGAAERGQILHRIFEVFLKTYGGRLPADALSRLLATGREIFEAMPDRPAIRAFWWPRFEAIASRFLEEQAERETAWIPARLEAKGVLHVDGAAGPFTLTAKADRIDRARSGKGLVVIDYKSGAAPGKKDLLAGASPQLPLEGVIAEAGGFAKLRPGEVERFEFWNLGNPNTAIVPPFPRIEAATLIAEARAGIAELVKRFDDPATPYLSNPDPEFPLRFAEYDLLARFDEWRFGGGGEP
jgi:ATP-dependent helicase/nuclease subunit B